MGFAPPSNLPSPGLGGGGGASSTPSADASAGFAPSPSGPSLCGFALPTFSYNLTFHFKFPPFAFPPLFNFFIAFKCDLSDPLSADFGFGGGRTSEIDKDADPEYGEGLEDAS